MKLKQRQIALAAAFILPVVAFAAWQGLREPTQADVPVDLQAEVDIADASLQLNPNPVALDKLRAPVESANETESEDLSPPEERAKEEDVPTDFGLCVKLKGAERHLGDHGQAQIIVIRQAPEIPTWSTEAMVVDGTAQFASLPEGTFQVEVHSSALEFALKSIITRPTAEGESTNELEFDLDETLAKAQENAAIATLRTFAAAQQQMQACCAIDTDGDGGGQYAFLAELAGTSPLRIYGPSGGVLGGPKDKLNPPFLASSLGEIQAAVQYGCVLRRGYYYRVHLPGLVQSEEDPVTGVYESPEGGLGSHPVDPSLGELYWGAYAWPAEAGPVPQRTFFINQEGDVAQLSGSQASPYFGLNSGPAFDAAYSADSPRDMRAQTAFAAMGLTANDGGLWMQAGH